MVTKHLHPRAIQVAVTRPADGLPGTSAVQYDLVLPQDLVLFVADANATQFQVECRDGRITRVEGGHLTEVGERIYRLFARRQFLAPRDQSRLGQQFTQTFRVWSDEPNSRIYAQATEDGALITPEILEGMIDAHIIALSDATDRHIEVG